MADLDTAIQQYQEALDRTPADHPEQASQFQSLAIAYYNKYLALGAIADLEIAIQQCQKSLDRTPAGYPEQASRFQSLGNAYRSRYRALGAIADLETAIQLNQEAFNRTPADCPEQASRFQTLGIVYHDKYLALGVVADLETAIQLSQEALNRTPADHPEQASRFQTLGIAYHSRYLALGAITDLEIAIQQHQEAVNRTPKNHPTRARRLKSLGSVYRSRYLALGAIADLETVIQQFQEALDRTPANHIMRIDRLERLGSAYRDRYLARGAIADLKIAIQQYEEVLDRTPADHPERASRLERLGAVYRDRYIALGTIADLEIAIQQYQEALDRTPADHPEQASRFQSLGNAYHSKYLALRVMADLETAIQQYQEALDKTPADYRKRASRLRNLGTVYYDKYRALGVMADLEIAIQRYQEALDKTPADYPERAGRLECLGNAYHSRYLALKVMADLETAIQQYQEALDKSSCPVNDRLRSGMALLALHANAQNWLEAFQTAYATVSLVPLFTPRSLDVSDKQRLLVNISGLASDAAAIALNAEKLPFDAIQLLELGREVIAGSLNEIRADISELQPKHPQLAEEYISLRDQLDTSETSIQRQVDQRYNTGQKLEEKIQTIRKLPGFDRFLLAPSEDELKSAAEYGPIVVINISKYRCDALIIENSRLRSLELPRLHISNIQDRTSESLASPEMLEWLWEAITQPILDILGFTQPPSDGCWPRIWWIPTGPLTKFPLHAAGRHTNGAGETVLDRVMSSYSSSIKAIIHGRRQQRDLGGTPSAPAPALLVAMEHTPGSSELPFATKEVEILRDLCRSMAVESVEPRRCKQDIMSRLPHCNIFHFAGHGYTDNDDPLKSYLLLEDGKSNALTVANLLELNLRKHAPFLAYLSACGTGRINGEKFVDENNHLISACQLAGYRHVIGTLWEVNDEICVHMARIIYEGIRDKGMTDESVCWGLHKAARELRDHRLSMPRNAKRGSKLAREENSSLGVDEVGADCANDGDQRDARLPRDIVSCDNEDKEVGPWVPYVHFGV